MKKLSVIIFGVLLCICIALLPMETQAATEGYFTYTVSDGKATITDCDTSISGDLTIPSTLGGYPVTAIGGSAFFQCNDLTSITIPASVTNIPAGVFRESEKVTGIWVEKNNAHYASDSRGVLYSKDMTQVIAAPRKLTGSYTVADGVTEIGRFAFFNCGSLTDVTIPDGVTKIDDLAFCHCTALTAVNIPDAVTYIGSSAFGYCGSLQSIVIPDGITTINDSTFQECKSLKTATIPDSVTEIGFEAFMDCTSLTEVHIPNVTSLEDFAFDGCESLTSVTLGEGLIRIGDSAFRNAKKLTAITIPNSVTEIDGAAFRNCINLKSVTIPAGVTNIEGNAFAQSYALEGIWVDPANANYASDEYGVMYSKDMTKLIAAPCQLTGTYTIVDGVTEIGFEAFASGREMTEVVIPESVKIIGDNAFHYCRKLISVAIPEGVTVIYGDTFEGCESLIKVEIPSSLTKIGVRAFGKCTSLAEVIYCGTEQQWKNIEVDNLNNWNDPLLNAKRTYHAWETTVTHKEPTCKEEGSADYVCIVCGEKKTEVIAKEAHVYESTWNSNAYGHWVVCNVCDAKGKFANHIPGDAATEEKAQTCTVCNYEIAPALGAEEKEPSFVIWIVIAAVVVVAGGAAAAVILWKKKHK